MTIESKFIEGWTTVISVAAAVVAVVASVFALSRPRAFKRQVRRRTSGRKSGAPNKGSATIAWTKVVTETAIELGGALVIVSLVLVEVVKAIQFLMGRLK